MSSSAKTGGTTTMAEPTAAAPVETSSEEEDEQDYGYNEELTESQRSSTVRASRRVNVTAEAAPYDISYRPGRVLFYSPPRQRQRWNDTQVLPRVNWGDLFFDLFYVAATYNVSNIVVVSPDRYGLLYAAGSFLPIMYIWVAKSMYDARYVTESDLYHRLVNIVLLAILAVAVLEIRPVEILSNPANESSMFVFALMLVLERVLGIVLGLELWFRGVGQAAIKAAAKRDLVFANICLPFYLAATVVAATEFFGDGGGKADRLLADAADKETTATSDVSSYGISAGDTTNVPIILCLSGFVSGVLIYGMNVMFCFPGGGRHKETSVPLNIDFMIHRYGEWIMLMLGESVFSLLIVDVSNEGQSFYTVFYCGILTVIFLQILHFQSQPHDADSHASRRSKNAGVLWSLFQYVYSLALVILGAAFTFFLILSEDEEGEGHRRLAGGDSSLDGSDVTKAAHLFCGSLAIIFFSLECMSVLHLGFNECEERCVLQGGKNYSGILLLLVKFGIIAFTATLSQWETDPQSLVIIALFIVLFQLAMRKLCGKFLSSHHCDPHSAENKDKDKPLSDDETGEAVWPNVTHPRAEPSAAEIGP